MHLPPAAEAMYFDGEPVAHILVYQERGRLKLISQRARRAIVGSLERRQRQDREVLRARFGFKS